MYFHVSLTQNWPQKPQKPVFSTLQKFEFITFSRTWHGGTVFYGLSNGVCHLRNKNLEVVEKLDFPITVDSYGHTS